MEIAIMILRLGITFVLSFIFGLERQRAHKPTGFGTFIFVAIGSCALAITAITMNSENPLPLLSAIVTGIGFLGAGALIKTTDKIFGFTTAASIWVFAILGLIIGVGYYLIGIMLYLLIWFIIFFDNFLESRGIGSYQRKLTILTNKIIKESDLKQLIRSRTSKQKLISVNIDKKNKSLCITYLIEGSKDEINKIPQMLFDKDWFESCRLE
ncbi:MAG: MgtC/SapB family protein [Nanoarchaeota archaeon]|nr:MgtC/SapB family protein [Nanoarchaeota archaeon]